MASNSERWLPISEYEGYYEISDQGRVKSLARSGRGCRLTDRILRPMLRGRPKYCTVALSRDGVRDTRKVHHLVLETFVGERSRGEICCHANDVPTDNRLKNLRWGTLSDNQYDSVRNGRHALATKAHCLSDHPLSGDNLYLTPGGFRACRECNRIAVRSYRLRKLAKVGQDA